MGMRDPKMHATIAPQIAALYDLPVAVGVTDPRVAQPEPMGREARHLRRAFPVRKREFAAGRTAARQAMTALGRSPEPIPAHPDRAPHWPEGLSGSISHTGKLCAAVLTTAPFHLGLDMEENADLEVGLLATICSDRELAHIDGPYRLRLAKLIFCAKEAAYKAQYPITRTLFGFDHIEISLDLAQQRFTAAFTKPVGCFAVGDKMPGKFDGIEDHLVTAVWTDHGGCKGA
ncbi:Phosphopantetheinyl transferase PptA [Sulfitobacter noctilucicola]|uniref:Enterobactin synthase component D n=1 Tax=Sulfitobacter noctilucicola TaxID=1342301 RepID=A0A7W6M8E6_9RHOB|nr:4'-phosphopantetheinyl transferase superfamily protein [Sulfitobacter noctilucicola]KIN64469.1 Phosphopantetheinyl transferase PptA [Sulfitobacter noctilucicola]MBB4174371.1 4'-phosphopantetheinyl transferase EntD [Sulfitobacter noctilucicola]